MGRVVVAHSTKMATSSTRNLLLHSKVAFAPSVQNSTKVVCNFMLFVLGTTMVLPLRAHAIAIDQMDGVLRTLCSLHDDVGFERHGNNVFESARSRSKSQGLCCGMQCCFERPARRAMLNRSNNWALPLSIRNGPFLKKLNLKKPQNSSKETFKNS